MLLYRKESESWCRGDWRSESVGVPNFDDSCGCKVKGSTWCGPNSPSWCLLRSPLHSKSHPALFSFSFEDGHAWACWQKGQRVDQKAAPTTSEAKQCHNSKSAYQHRYRFISNTTSYLTSCICIHLWPNFCRGFERCRRCSPAAAQYMNSPNRGALKFGWLCLWWSFRG